MYAIRSYYGVFAFRRGGSADLRRATRLALCLLTPGTAGAADPAPPPPPVRQVGEVTASATRGEREVLDVPGNVTVIDRDA